MTRGGLKTDQKMVDEFVRRTIPNPSTMTQGISLEDFGINETMTFTDLRDFLSRGLCLYIQGKERKVETVNLKDRIRILEQELANRKQNG